ncbi:MAG: ParB N-terminal domain-containing protein [Desulfobacterales bacterium]|nr:ParB N-terminal domain-containing protein [Desulfobacterales bacterium]
MANKKQSEIVLVDYKKIYFDNEENPRLPGKLAGADDREILNHMVLRGNALELMKSVGEKGFFAGEPLLVIKAKGKQGRYIVIEGNRRLSAVKLLHDPGLATVKKVSLTEAAAGAKKKPDAIPVIIYPSRDHILDYLGYRHITGIKEWESLAKTKYLHKLYQRSEESAPDKKCKELARIIGSRADYVRKLLCALSVYNEIQDNDYFGIAAKPGDISFSLITTALGYNNIQEFLGLESGEEIHPENLNTEHLRELTIWMFDKREGSTRIGESRNLGMLAKVVSNPDSLEEFRAAKTLEAAYMASEGPNDMVIKAIMYSGEQLDMAYKYAIGITLGPTELKRLEHISKTALAIKKLATPDYDD